MDGRLMMINLNIPYSDQDIQKVYKDKYGEFDEDPENYFMKAYIEVIEAAKHQCGQQLK